MFFPIPLELKTAVPAHTKAPAANALLIFINVLIFVCGGFWPVGPSTGLLTIVLYGFTHFGWWHLVMNMWALCVFGNPLNRRLGNSYYLLVYLGSLVFVGLVGRLLTTTCLVGASGAIFAVIIVALMLMPAAVLETAYLALFPLSLLIGLVRRPAYGLNWFIAWGLVSAPALACLVLIPLMELSDWLFSASYYGWAWSWGPAAHLLGVLCGVAAVLMLPASVTLRRRAWAAA